MPLKGTNRAIERSIDSVVRRVTRSPSESSIPDYPRRRRSRRNDSESSQPSVLELAGLDGNIDDVFFQDNALQPEPVESAAKSKETYGIYHFLTMDQEYGQLTVHWLRNSAFLAWILQKSFQILQDNVSSLDCLKETGKILD